MPALNTFVWILIPSDSSQPMEEQTATYTDINDTTAGSMASAHHRQQLDRAGWKGPLVSGMIPVQCPQPSNDYTASMLYCIAADPMYTTPCLNVNLRATALSRTEIRGDCFYLKSRDKINVLTMLSEEERQWMRLDSSVEEVKAILSGVVPHPLFIPIQITEFGTPEIHMKDALHRKEQGNTYFRQTNYDLALVAYDSGINLLKSVRWNASDSIEVSALLGTLFLNKAQCQCKLGGQWREARASAGHSLGFKRTLKGLHCRIRISLELSGDNDFEDWVRWDLTEAYTFIMSEDDVQSFQALKENYEKKVKESRVKEQQTYARMFA
eukprot:PhF_6_TR15060/c0_g1_i2/m.23664